MLLEVFGRNADVYAYFNNDPLACALRDASNFARECDGIGLHATRTPALGDVRVG
jgi:hypothetical protein